MSEPTNESADRPFPQSSDDGASPPPSSGAEVSSSRPAPPDLPDLARSPIAARQAPIDLLSDVSLQVRVELGRTRMLVEDVLRLGADSVVELDKAAGDPVDVYVNGRHIARGEVLVLNESFCVRVNEIIEPFQAVEMMEAGASPTATLRPSVPRGEVA